MRWMKWFSRKRKIGQDFDDNLPTKGKRYYMSHVDYVFKESSIEFRMFGNEVQKISQLVCATNMENARKAVEASLGDNKIVLKNRIDYLVVGV